MKYRTLGEGTGLRVSEVALGTGRIGIGGGGESDPIEAGRVLRAFADAGGTLIDTSSAYQGGRAEEMLGDFLAEAGRDAFVVSSKYTRTTMRQPPVAAFGNHRGAMQREVEGSLRRLKTDRIDLYFAHLDDGLTPVEEIMRGFDELARAGKIVHAGLSNFPAWRTAAAAAARGTTPLAAVQLQYNLLERSIEREHLPLARARGFGVLAWSPLAGGRLKGGSAPAVDAAPVKDVVERVARELACDAATIALAWVMAKGALPVIGARHRGHLEASLRTLELRFTEGHVQRLDAASAKPLGYPYDLVASSREGVGIAGDRVGAIL